MGNFDLYYWPVPFRGQFIRAILAFRECQWDEFDAETISELMDKPAQDQPIGFMGPPVLVDKALGFAISQMPAIALYLGERLNLLPDSLEDRALVTKIINDANDVIDELTLDGGREMWSEEKWQTFVPRLEKWIGIFDDMGRRHGLTAEGGFILGTPEPCLADIVTAVLWDTMSERFSGISSLLKRISPTIYGLSRRIMMTPSLAKLKTDSFDRYGDAYCGGEIEKSLRAVAG